ncbi:TlpA family protein disulfide reductase [Parapedobacter sp. 10938]|uniref:TlpA family protein disulfide reductase n=1 Tax=Parapedobacter flavus TaxID=3110225 RepID=UPI002DB9480D|nr:TlpA disulfide reductase family protein [Parapedobacter sp. 10938]MEC3879139.1 TlpA disulfide reductase family protein [Parapedobacter sp. 10938]
MEWTKVNYALILMVLCFSMPLLGQEFYRPSEVTVRMGETLPESFFSTPHKAIDMATGEDRQIILGDYKDKLIILDFWATWCKPCLYSMNKLDSLQSAMAGEAFVVIPVTGQNPAEMAPAIRKYRWTTPSIVGDRTLARIFPHQGIPHQVWIKNGKVLAIPHWTSATSDHIRQVMAGRTPQMPMNIVDWQFDPDSPILQPVVGKTKLYRKNKHSMICGKIPGIGTENLQIVRKEDSTVLYALNLPISVLYYQAFKDDIFPSYSVYRGAIDWQISDSLRSVLLARRPKLLMGNTAREDSLFVDWENNHLYSYELRYPGNISDKEAYAIMRKDLNTFFGEYRGIQGDIVPGPKMRYGILKPIESREKTLQLLQAGLGVERPADSTEYHFANGQYRSQLYSLMVQTPLNHITDVELSEVAPVDSTRLDPELRVGIHFPKAMLKGWPLNRVNLELKRYGLFIQIEDKQPPLLAIKETTAE